MRPRPAIVALAVLAALLSCVTACGGKNPTSPSSSVVSLTMTLSPFIRVGESIQASATAARSDGSAQLVGTGWTSNNSGVATVTDAGYVTGVRNGQATISVTSGGQQAGRDIRVVPDYEGSWAGTFRLTSCTPFPSAAYSHFCVGYAPGSVMSVTMTFTQAGDGLSGQFIANDLVFVPFVTRLDGNGGAVLQGANVGPTYLTETQWIVSSDVRGQMTGSVRWERRGSSGLVGGTVIEGTIVALARR